MTEVIIETNMAADMYISVPQEQKDETKNRKIIKKTLKK
jgi:hypothetical protein